MRIFTTAKLKKWSALLLACLLCLVLAASCTPKPTPIQLTACVVEIPKLDGEIRTLTVYISTVVYANNRAHSGDDIYICSFAEDAKFIDADKNPIDRSDIAVGDMVYFESKYILGSGPPEATDVALLQVTGKADEAFLQAGLERLNAGV